MTISKRNFVDYSLLFMVIAISGIPYFSTTTLYIPVSIILIFTFLIRRCNIDKEFIFLITILTIITIFQTYVFDFFSIQTTLGVYLRLIIGYLIIKILNKKFIPYYINILYYLSIMGTIVFLSVVLLPFLIPLLKGSLIPLISILNFAGTNLETIIIYNFAHLDEVRNSGPFWEPGAFGGYLILAIIFIYFNNNVINKNKKLIILLLALITTVSTTAFAALGIFLFFYYFKSIKNVFIKIIVSSFLITGAFYAYSTFDILGKKIESQLEMAKNANAYGSDNDTQRFLNILRDIEDFKGHELVGRGSNPITRYAFKNNEQIRTVGITDIIVRMGFPFFLVMLYFLYKSMYSIVNNNNSNKKQNTLFAIGTFSTILITLMSEVYFNFPLYWSLLFIFVIYKENRNIIQNNYKVGNYE